MDVRQEYLDKARAELGDLAQAGVIMTGNAFSHVLLVKGEPEGPAADGSVPRLLEGPDGKALHAGAGALGYAPEDWGGLSVNDAEGYPLVPGTLRLAIATLDPDTLVAPRRCRCRRHPRGVRGPSSWSSRAFDAATLSPGLVVRVLGMRVLALGGFEKSLSDPKAKQLMWARLKQLPPQGEPY